MIENILYSPINRGCLLGFTAASICNCGFSFAKSIKLSFIHCLESKQRINIVGLNRKVYERRMKTKKYLKDCELPLFGQYRKVSFLRYHTPLEAIVIW